MLAHPQQHTQRRPLMRRVVIGLVAVGSLLSILAGQALAQATPDATLTLSQGSVAAGIGFSWGKGMLSFQGNSYPVTVEGLSVGEVGITRATANGKVYNLKNLADFDGNYAAAVAGATIAGGAEAIAMRNQNGVVIELTTTTQGASLKLAVAGLSLSVQK